MCCCPEARRAREYLVGKYDAVERDPGAIVLNPRPLEEAFDLGNEFGLIFLELIGPRTVRPAYAVRANMRPQQLQ
jgi:hypothetical protein